jgi:hypothetical protein
MPPRTARALLAVLAVPIALLADLVLSAGPASAHVVSAGALPAPSWLLGWFGAVCVLGTAVALRTSWPRARLHIGAGDDAVGLPDDLIAGTTSPWAALGHAVGLAFLGAVVVTAIVGPNEPAANIAPLIVYPVWWLGLPLLCLLAGDVMAALNPFVLLVAAIERAAGRERVARWQVAAPSWTAAASLWASSWFLFAYYRPGSPRAVAVFLVLYAVAATAGGLRWGRGWLRAGEGFAGISHSVAHLVRRRDEPHPPGLLALLVVWVGATAFHGVSTTLFWIDLEGTTTGWPRTAVNTLGLVWLTGVAAFVAMVAIRVLDDRRRPPVDDADEAVTPTPWPASSPAALLGLALVPLALAWLVAHELTFALFEGQNVIILLSDPIGRGWDLFHTVDLNINYRLARGGWVRWAQLILLLTGHIATVVLAHDGAVRILGRRRGMRVTWTVAGLSAASIVGACLLVLR